MVIWREVLTFASLFSLLLSDDVSENNKSREQLGTTQSAHLENVTAPFLA